MSLILHQPLLICRVVIYSLNFVADDPVLINQGAENQVCSLLLDQDVTIGANLVKPG